MSEVEVCRMTTARHPLRATNVVLALLCVMYFINYVVRVNVNTAALVCQNELHLSNTQVGLIFSTFAFRHLVFQFIGGWASDRWGARKALTIFAVIWPNATMWKGIPSSLDGMTVSRVLPGIALPAL